MSSDLVVSPLARSGRRRREFKSPPPDSGERTWSQALSARWGPNVRSPQSGVHPASIPRGRIEEPGRHGVGGRLLLLGDYLSVEVKRRPAGGLLDFVH
jgi:hypothetical protein